MRRMFSIDHDSNMWKATYYMLNPRDHNLQTIGHFIFSRMCYDIKKGSDIFLPKTVFLPIHEFNSLYF